MGINFRRLFLGSQEDISRNELKRLMLSGFLAVMSLSVSVFYAIFDLINHVHHSLIAYVGLAVGSLLSIFFLRHGRFRAAKVLLMVTSNLVVFWAAITDPFETGVYLFFIPAGIGAFAMLGSDETTTSILLAIFTTALFLVAYVAEWRPIEVEIASRDYIRWSFLFNYFISLTICILAISFLISLNRHSENELIEKEIAAKKKNEELQKVNIELDRFVYSVSHDLRSPLSSILGLINIAKLTEDHEEVRRILAMIEGRVNSQDHFIREIIDYARNARTETVRETFSFKPLIDEVINALRYSMHSEKIVFRVNIPDTLQLNTDRIRLTVVLSNLIGNAIKYHDSGKQEQYVDITFDEAAPALIVTDNGLGILPAHVDRIFDMFFRASENSSGSGLGLFITRETITKLGGRIEVSSAFGEGSTFTVFLPPDSFFISKDNISITA